MINTINLKNFKLHRNTTIDFGKINVFIGPNNSGKSSVIHAMHVLAKRYNCSAKESNEGYYIDKGKSNDFFISEGEYFSEIEVTGNIPLSDLLSPSEIEFASKFISKNINIKTNFRLEKDRNLFLKDWELELEMLEERVKEVPEKIINKDGDEEYISSYFINKMRPLKPSSQHTKLILDDGSSITIQELNNIVAEGKITKDDNSAFLEISKLKDLNNETFFIFQRIINNSVRKLVESFHFVYPIRGFEQIEYDVQPSPPTKTKNFDSIYLGKRAETLANAFHYDRPMEYEINEKINESGIVKVKFFALPLSKEKVTLLSKISEDKNIPFLFEGLGSHQMLFIYLPIFYAKQNDTICIEEPENHLHPKAQYELAKLFVNIVKKEEKQLVITTHSEHIIYGFLNSVANGKLKKNELRIYYFKEPVETIPDVKEARVEKLNINEFGQVEGGLPGFFETKRKELSEFLNPPDKNK